MKISKNSLSLFSRNETEILCLDSTPSKEKFNKFCAVLKNNTSLKELNICNFELSLTQLETLCDAIKNHPSLSKLIIQTPIGDAGAFKIAKLLEENKTITELELKHTQIYSRGALYLALALRNNTKLLHLNLHHNPIGDGGACAFVELLKNNHSLQSINLSRNKISPVGIKSLAEALLKKDINFKIDLRGNHLYKDKQMTAIDNIIKSKKDIITFKMETKTSKTEDRVIYSLMSLGLGFPVAALYAWCEYIHNAIKEKKYKAKDSELPSKKSGNEEEGIEELRIDGAPLRLV